MTQISINTTQNVDINFEVAALGDRFAAYILDSLIKIAYIIFMNKLVFSFERTNFDNWSMIALTIIVYSPVIFYSLILETFLEGQTIGKKSLGIKVVKLDGYQAGISEYLIRWIFRLIDISGSFYIIGLVSMITSKKMQRIGDIAASTAVISLRNKINISHTIFQNLEQEYVPRYPLVIKLSDNDMRIIKDTYISAKKNDDILLLDKLADKIKDVTGIIQQEKNVKAFIDKIIKDYNFYTQNLS